MDVLTILRSLYTPVDHFVKSLHDFIWIDFRIGPLAIMVWVTLGLFLLTVGRVAIPLAIWRLPRYVLHSLGIFFGKYEKEDANAPGQIPSRQSTTSAVSSTVGLGNIGGVSVAVALGGPAVVPIMAFIGLLCMYIKSLGVGVSHQYREVNPDGTVNTGPMNSYLKPKYIGWIGKILVPIFALGLAISAIASGNMFQANQVAEAMSQEAGWGIPTWITGLVLLLLAAYPIFSGIEGIGKITEKIVPIMCLLYVLGCGAVIILNWHNIGNALSQMFTGYVPAIGGAVAGLGVTLAWALQRALFSSEAGQGSAETAHGAAKTWHSPRQAFAALLEPMIDTCIICVLTGLTLVISGVGPNFYGSDGALVGVAFTQAALSTAHPWLGMYILPTFVALFAYSTILGWAYYGQQGVQALFGKRAIIWYNILYIACIFLGSIIELAILVYAAGIMIAVMLIINLLAINKLLGGYIPIVQKYIAEYIDGKTPPKVETNTSQSSASAQSC